MEDVLDLYEEPYDPKCPVVCFDEMPYQMVAETRTRVPAKPGRVSPSMVSPRFMPAARCG